MVRSPCAFLSGRLPNIRSLARHTLRPSRLALAHRTFHVFFLLSSYLLQPCKGTKIPKGELRIGTMVRSARTTPTCREG